MGGWEIFSRIIFRAVREDIINYDLGNVYACYQKLLILEYNILLIVWLGIY